MKKKEKKWREMADSASTSLLNKIKKKKGERKKVEGTSISDNNKVLIKQLVKRGNSVNSEEVEWKWLRSNPLRMSLRFFFCCSFLLLLLLLFCFLLVSFVFRSFLVSFLEAREMEFLKGLRINEKG